MNTSQEPLATKAGFLNEPEKAASPGHLSSGRLRQLLTLLTDLGRRNDAEAIIETIASLQVLADNGTDALYLKDREGRYLLANAPFAAATHHTLDELLGRRNRELFHHLFAECLNHADAQVLQGELFSGELQLGEGNDARVFQVTKIPFRVGSAQVIGVLGVMREKNPKPIANSSAANSDDEASPDSARIFSEQIIQHAREGIAVLDDRLRFQLWNPFMEEFIGIPKQKVLGKLPLEIFPTAAEVGLMAHLERALQGTTINRIDLNLDTIKGVRSAWASCSFSPHRNARGEIIGVICVASDIGDYKKGEAALRRSQQFNQQIISNSNYGIVVYDRELRYMVWNPAMEEMSGLPLEHVQGRRATEVFHGAQEQGLTQMLQQALKGDAIESVDFRLAPHKPIWVRAHYGPLRDGDEKVIGVIGLVTDVTARRQAEEALRDSKQFNEQIINSSLEGIAVFDRDLRVLVWNSVMADISGKPRAETQGKAALELFPFARGTDVEGFWQAALQGEVVAGQDFRFPHDNTRWVSAMYGPLRNQRGVVVGMIVTVRDISARRRAEAALRESRQFSEQVINSTLDSIAVHDTELNYVLWNPAMERLTQVKASEAIGQHPLKFFPDLRENGLFEAMQRALVGEVSPRADYAYSDGRGWYNAQIAPLRDEHEAIVGVITVLRDVTDRHQIEDALRDSKQLNEQIIQTVKEGIVVHDRKLNYVEWNPFMETLYGQPRAEIVGQHPYALFPELQQTAFPQMLERVLQGESVVTRDLQRTRPNGETAWLNVRYEPLRAPDCEITGVLGVVNDVTEHKRAEDSLRALHEFSAQIVESAREGFIVYDQSSKVKVWNRFMEEITGLKQEQVLGQNPQAMFPYLRTSDHLNLMSTASSGDSVTGQDFQYESSATGKAYCLSARYGPHKGPQGEIVGVIMTLRDMTARRFAEQAVSESEARYRNILDSIQEGYFEFNLQGDLSLFNDALCQMYGCDKSEMYGKAHRQWITREAYRRVVQVFNHVLETREPSAPFDYEVIRKDGERRTLEAAVTLVTRDEASQNPMGQIPMGYRGLVRDVTERRAAEARVAHHARFAALRADVIETVTAELALPEMLQRCADAVAQHLNANFASLWLVNDDDTELELRAQAGAARQPADLANPVAMGNGRIGRIAATRRPEIELLPEPLSLATSGALASGFIDETAALSGMAFAGCPLVTNAVTHGVLAFWSVEPLLSETQDSLRTIATLIAQGIERRQMQQSLKTNEDRFRALIEHSYDGVILINVEGCATYVSPAQQHILGYETGALLGKELANGVHPDDRDALRAALKTLAAGQSARLEYRVRNVHGDYLWMEGTFTNLLHEPAVQAVVVNFHDITAAKHAETERARVEVSLRESETQMRSIWTHVLDAMLLLNDAGTYTDANPAACQLFGLRQDELIGQHFSMFSDPEHREAAMQAWQHLLETSRDAGSFQMPLPGRGTRWIEYTSMTNVLPGRHLIVYRDITERRDAESAVRASETRFRALTESAWDGIAMQDAEGRVLYASPSYTKILGYSADEVLATDQQSRLHPDELEMMAQARDEALALPGKQVIVKHRTLHKDGTWRLLETAATNLLEDENINAIVFNFRDITERDKAEQSLRASEQRFRALVEKSFDGVILQHPKAGFVYVSPAMTRILGYSSAELKGRLFKDFMHPDQAEFVQEMRDQVANHPGQTQMFEVQLRHQDGSWRWLELAATNMVEDPIIGAVVVNFHDITERKQAEDALRQREATFRAIWDHAMDAMLVVNDAMEYVDANPAACELYGVEREDILHRTMADFMPPEKRGSAELSLKKLVARGERKGQFQMLRPDHTIREIEYSARANFMPGFHISVMRDVTERTRAEDQLRASEDRYRSVVTSLDEGILMIGSGGELLACNESTERILGMSRDEMLERGMIDPVWRSIHEDGTPFSVEDSPAFHTLRTGEPCRGIVWGLERPDEAPVWISVNSHPIYQGEAPLPYAVVLSMNDITERKRAEAARDESEKRFAAIFKASPLPICLNDMETGQQLEMNPAWVELFGYSSEEAVGRTGLELGLWERPQDRADYLAQLRRDGVIRNFEMVARTRQGELRYLLNSCETMELNGKSYFLSVNHDITERKQAEERFAKAFDANPNPMLIMELHARCVVQVNDAWQKFTGFSAAETIDLSWRGEGNFVSPEQRHQFLEQVIMRGNVRDFESELFTADRRVRTVLLSAEAIELSGQPHLIISCNDITIRKQAEEALRVSEERFSKAFNACPDPMAITTIAEGRYEMVNDAWLKGNGLKKEEVIGRNSQELELWDDPEERRRFYEQIVLQGPVRDFETRLRNAQGGVDDVLTSSDMVMLGGEWYVLSVTRNITERKRAEEALKVSEHRFATTFNACPEPMMLHRLADGCFVTMNAVALRALGLSEKDVVGRTAQDINLWVDDQQRQSLEQQLQSQGEVRDFECRFTLKGGRLGDFLVSAEILDVDGAPHVLLVSRDITERKRAEAALRAKEEQLAQTFNACPEPMLLTREEDGVIVAINEATLSIYGREREHFIGKPVKEFSLWAIPEQQRAFNQALKTTGVVKDMDAAMRTKDEQFAQFLLSAERMSINGVTHILCIGRDITERKQAEAALRASEEKFSKAFTASPHPMTMATFPGGQLLMVNEAWCRLHGYSAAEALSQNSAELQLWVTAELRASFYQQVTETGSARNFECEMRHRDGSVRQLLLSGERIQLGTEEFMLSIALDLTERRLAEAALRASEDRFEQAFRLSPCPLVVNGMDGRIVYVNEAVTKATGYEPSELIGKTALEAGLWADIEQRKAMLHEFKDAGSVRNREMAFLTRDGRLVTVLYSSEQVEFNGAPHVLSSLVDITEMKRIEGALRASQERFATAFHASPQAMLICQSGGGAIVSANPSLLKLVGRPDHEIIGLKASDLAWWEHLDFQQELDARLQAEAVIRDWRTTLRHADGSLRTVDVSVDPIQIDDTAHLLFNLTDVTEREQVELELRGSEERFSKAFHASPQALLIVRNENGQIVTTNRSFCLMMGYDEENLLGSSLEALQWWVKPHQEKTFKQLLKHNGHLRDWTTELRRQDGAERVVQISVEPVALNGMAHLLYLFMDITESRQREEALRASEERFSTAFQANPQPMGIWRTSDQQFVYVNQALVNMLGRAESEIVGQSVSDIAWWANESMRADFLRRLETQRKVQDYEARWEANPEDVRTCLLSAENIRLDQQPHVLVVALDITERQRAEVALRASEERFSKSFNASPQPMALANWPGGELVSINQSLLNASGYSREELIGKRLVDINAWLTPNDRNRFLQAASTGQLRDWEVRLRIKSGELANFLISGESVELGGKPHLLVTATDITARKRAEALVAGQVTTLELMASGAKLPAVLDTIARFVDEQQLGARTAVCLVDAGSLRLRECYAPGLPLSFRQRVTGFELSAESGLIGATITAQQLTVFADWQQHASWERLGEMLTAEGIRGAWALPIFNTQRRVLGTIALFYAETHQPSDAERKVGDIAAQLVGIALERHEAEEALRESESRYRQLFERNLAGVYRENEEGKYLECNEAFANIVGAASAAELTRLNSTAFYFETADRDRYLRLLRKQGSVTNYEMRLRRLDESEVWVLCNATLIEREGEPVVLEGVLLDITKRKYAEAKLNEQREQLRALTAKISAVREEERTVISREIHDSLGQLLTGLKLDISWLSKRINQHVEGDTRKLLVKKTDGISELLDQTIGTVRELATQLRPGVLDTLGLTAAIEWQVEDLKTRSGMECELWLCPEPKNLPQEKVTVIFRILQEILTNIIRHAEATRVVIHLMPNKDDLLLTVIDNGRGITAAEMQHQKSLGLLGMRERANSVGGEVKLEGAAGRGTTVTVRIPLGPVTASPFMNISGMLTQR